MDCASPLTTRPDSTYKSGKVVQTSGATCKFVVVAEEDDGAEFVNDSGEHNGCIYARFYFEDEDAEMSREKVVVIRG